MNDKSEVEIYWERIAEKFGDARKYHELNTQQQQTVIHSINAMLAVLHRIV
jgi:hypothetical protein